MDELWTAGTPLQGEAQHRCRIGRPSHLQEDAPQGRVLAGRGGEARFPRRAHAVVPQVQMHQRTAREQRARSCCASTRLLLLLLLLLLGFRKTVSACPEPRQFAAEAKRAYSVVVAAAASTLAEALWLLFAFEARRRLAATTRGGGVGRRGEGGGEGSSAAARRNREWAVGVLAASQLVLYMFSLKPCFVHECFAPGADAVGP
jgi:hypothetical protein